MAGKTNDTPDRLHQDIDELDALLDRLLKLPLGPAPAAPAVSSPSLKLASAADSMLEVMDESLEVETPVLRFSPKVEVAELKHFGKPDEVREFPKGRVELINIGGATIGRAIFEPGWRWASSVQPLAKTKSCEAPHFQYHVSGRLAIRMDDGTEMIAGPGAVTSLPKGHDAWVVGDEPAVIVDFYGASNYAKA